MKLKKVRITNFKSIQDSNEFEIGDVTCLVGKNEAGKTALLQALYCLNPLADSNCVFDSVTDYPRQSLSDYENAIESGSEPDNIVQATYVLEPDDVKAISNIFGTKCINDDAPIIEVNKGYSNETKILCSSIDEQKAIAYLIDESGLPQALRKELHGKPVPEVINVLENKGTTDSIEQLTQTLRKISDRGFLDVVHEIRDRLPRFLYFDQYYQLRGEDNLENLIQRVEDDSLLDSDRPLLGLIALAGLKLEQMIDPQRTEILLSRLEAAENRLTQDVLPYWSQNQHLRMTFDVRPAQPGDSEGMQSGTNILGRVRDTKRNVSTPLRTRSRGFVWFFSFLSWYSKVRKEERDLILLLDEPGLSLHARAQSDLLRYIEKELKPHHQVIYTTHSPFMVDPRRFDRVRIVQDLSIDKAPNVLAEGERGTRVITDVLDATDDTLFPLQGALGYDIHQTLFVGPNCLIVEGVSDLVYLRTISSVLQDRERIGLSSDWTITPVGGAGKVPTFVSLIGSQVDLAVAVLMDYQTGGRQSVENLYKRKLLKKNNVFTYADYTDGEEADVEDMFGVGFYLKIVERAYGISIDPNELLPLPRVVQRVERYLGDHPLSDGAQFNHYRPASYLNRNIDSLASDLTDEVLDRFQRAFDDLNALLKTRGHRREK